MTNSHPWWEDFASLAYPPNFPVDPTSADFPLPERTADLEDLPDDLTDLLATSVAFNAAGDYAGAWRVQTSLGRTHWYDQPDLDTLPKKSAVEWFQQRISITDFLELSDERDLIQAEWLEWAERNLDSHNELLSLAYRAISELHSDTATIGGFAFPLTLQFVNRVELMSAAPMPVVGAAAIVLAEACLSKQLVGLAESIARHEPKLDAKGANTDALKLLRAHIAWHQDDIATAEDLLAQVEYQPVNNALTSVFEAHNLHAYLEFLRENHEASFAHVRAAATIALQNDFIVAGLGSAAMYVKYLHDSGEIEHVLDFGGAYLRAAHGLPVSSLHLDLQLLVANAYFMAGDYEEAGAAAMAVAGWSQMTDEDSRTTLAFIIAAEVRCFNDDIAGAMSLMKDTADFMKTRGNMEDWAMSLRHAARFAALSPDQADRDRALLWLNETAPTSEVDRALWLMLHFTVLQAADRDRADIADIETAAEIFVQHGEVDDAAKAYLIGIRYLVEQYRFEEAHSYCDRVALLVDHQNADPELLEIAHEILDEG
ncbi:hypothetical protein [Corynebacterium ulceribovis]|uniref:hypothetical protein n=1 Tax=Corynebacterium ulceribovis TaxID=487732 RepID=UPI000371D9ED|nr:hypothetical protein [Corynebacterium ulceribovis]